MFLYSRVERSKSCSPILNSSVSFRQGEKGHTYGNNDCFGNKMWNGYTGVMFRVGSGPFGESHDDHLTPPLFTCRHGSQICSASS